MAGSRSESCGAMPLRLLAELVDATGADDELEIGGVTSVVLERGESDKCAVSGSDERSSYSVLEADEVDCTVGTPDAMAAAVMLALSSCSAEFEARPEVLSMISSHERRRERVSDDESGVSADTIEAAVELEAIANCASMADIICCAVMGVAFFSRAAASLELPPLVLLVVTGGTDDDEPVERGALALLAPSAERGRCFWSCVTKAR